MSKGQSSIRLIRALAHYSYLRRHGKQYGFSRVAICREAWEISGMRNAFACGQLSLMEDREGWVIFDMRNKRRQILTLVDRATAGMPPAEAAMFCKGLIDRISRRAREFDSRASDAQMRDLINERVARPF